MPGNYTLPSNLPDTFNLNVRHPWAEGYNIRINSRWYRTVANNEVPLTIVTKDTLAERQDLAGSTYDNVLDIGYAWARTDVSGGEGLDWDPRTLALERDQEALDKIRYWDSVNIDVSRPEMSGNAYAIRLARDSKIWDPGFSELIDIAVSDKYIYVADGTTVRWFPDWEMPVTDWADIPSRIVAIAAAPNDTVMVTCENGNVYAKRSIEANFTKVYGDSGTTKLAAQGIWYMQGRFIISAWDHIDHATQFTIERRGDHWDNQNPIDTASSPFWSVVEAGPSIVAACGDGTVRSYAPDSKSGIMDLVPWSRTTMPEGEAPYLLGSNSGVLLIMTSMSSHRPDLVELRLYQAEVLSEQYSYLVGQLQLKREWLAPEHEPLVTRNMASTRDEIFWFVKEADLSIPDDVEVAVESLWRYDMVTTGLSRESVIGVRSNQTDPSLPPVQDEQYDLDSLVVFNGVAGSIDHNLHIVHLGDKKKFRDYGYMIFPNITFGMNTEITWMSTILEARRMSDEGAQVELWRSTDPEAIHDWQHPSWVLAQRLSSDGGSGIEVPMVGIKSRTLSLQLRVHASDFAERSPYVTRVAVRGIPAHRDFVMAVPINVSDYVSAPGRRPVRYPGHGEALHAQMLDMVGASVEVAILKPNILFRGIVNNVSEPVRYVSSRGSATTYVMVEFRGTRMLTTSIPTGDAGIGLGLLGITTVGIGQTEQE